VDTQNTKLASILDHCTHNTANINCQRWLSSQQIRIDLESINVMHAMV